MDPRNECFCGGECVPSGTVNVSTCRFGAPGFVSFPHFFRADPAYRDNVTGMRPDPSKHDMYIILEPVIIKKKFFSLKIQKIKNSILNFFRLWEYHWKLRHVCKLTSFCDRIQEFGNMKILKWEFFFSDYKKIFLQF